MFDHIVGLALKRLSFSKLRILLHFIKYRSWMERLLKFFAIFLILSFQSCGIACLISQQWNCMLFLIRNWFFRHSQNFMESSKSKSLPGKFKLLFDRLWKQLFLLSIFTCLLNQVNWHATVDGNVTGEEKYLLHLKNSSWSNFKKLRTTERPISKLEWNKIFP